MTAHTSLAEAICRQVHPDRWAEGSVLAYPEALCMTAAKAATEWLAQGLARGSRHAVIEPDLAKRLDMLVAEAEGKAPVSFESLVNTAVEALLDGAGA